jgi:hypothetical protein
MDGINLIDTAQSPGVDGRAAGSFVLSRRFYAREADPSAARRIRAERWTGRCRFFDELGGRGARARACTALIESRIPTVPLVRESIGIDSIFLEWERCRGPILRMRRAHAEDERDSELPFAISDAFKHARQQPHEQVRRARGR